MRIPTPDYVLIEEVKFYAPPSDSIVLPAGTFVRPIELTYVPKHIKEGYYKDWYSEEHYYCYTSYGILPILKKNIRKVSPW